MIRAQLLPAFMSFSGKPNSLINKVHNRPLRIISRDNHSSFKNLRKCKEITFHQRNLQVLMTEMYKIINGISPPITGEKSLYNEKIRTT